MKKSDWYNETIQKISNLSTNMEKKQVRKYRLSLLIKMITRVEEFSLQNCEQCEKHKAKINQMMSILEQNKEGNSEKTKEFRTIFGGGLKHLKKDHGLVEEGTYLSLWLSLGIIFGAAFMSIYTYSISIGMLFGIAIGSMLDSDAKKKGKQI